MTPSLRSARFYLMRVRRDGPIVPARLWWCDSDPADPTNKRDRGNLSIWPRADIAGEEVDPELLFDRLMSHTNFEPAHAPTHWRFAQPVSQAVYDYHFKRMRWAEQNQPDDPVLKPRRPVDPNQMALPNFDNEHARLRRAG